MEPSHQPLVSVIIPVYNTEHSLDCCFKSVIGQAYTNLEIIIVNDGSTDNSRNIISSYAEKDKRIILVDKLNEGLVQARKTGVMRATGKYIQYLDSDDSFCENVIGLLVDKAEQTQADMVVAPFIFHEGEKAERSVFPDFTELTGVDFLRNILMGKAYWCVWSKFHLRSLYQGGIERPDISLGEDVILSTQLLVQAQKVVSIDSPIIDYNFTSVSMSHPATFNDQKYNDFLNYINWLEHYVSKCGLDEELRYPLAYFHLKNTFLKITWKRFREASRDMKRVVRDVKAFPDLTSNLSKREQKIVAAYSISNLWGRIKLWKYHRQGKI